MRQEASVILKALVITYFCRFYFDMMSLMARAMLTSSGKVDQTRTILQQLEAMELSLFSTGKVNYKNE